MIYCELNTMQSPQLFIAYFRFKYTVSTFFTKVMTDMEGPSREVKEALLDKKIREIAQKNEAIKQRQKV